MHETKLWAGLDGGMHELNQHVCISVEHFADDLEADLQDAMEQDFHMVLEDGSPLQVRRLLGSGSMHPVSTLKEPQGFVNLNASIGILLGKHGQFEASNPASKQQGFLAIVPNIFDLNIDM